MLIVEAWDAERMGESSGGRCLWPAQFTVHRNLISALSAAAFEHALSTNVTSHSINPYYLSRTILTPRAFHGYGSPDRVRFVLGPTPGPFC
jgi:hypothetical protein